ncbi:SA1362 family protein [Gracilibacillus xinjiangensis]|uniref:SA1362 family protein n=1 Tax=Gracilibacillus xinjiangensis TaxID=1193282 RepID=A0ABV8WWY3_9BACI
MSRNIMTWLVYGLIGLAVIGFIGSLFTDTIGLIMNLLIAVLTGAVIFGLVYFFFLRKRTSNELKKYRKAVKQSKQKYKTTTHSNNITSKSTKLNQSIHKIKPNNKQRKDVPHLRVIEGNNNKKRKNRASL